MYASRAAFEQNLRETAGRRSDVKANAAFRIKAKMVEGAREFHAAARYVWMRGRSVDFRAIRVLFGGLEHRLLVDRYQSGLDRSLRLGATFE